jgi:predicted ATPase
MKICSARLVNFRCFKDSLDLHFHSRMNIFVGKNNSGKSTLLRAILALQFDTFTGNDLRPGSLDSAYRSVTLDEIDHNDTLHQRRHSLSRINYYWMIRGSDPFSNQADSMQVSSSSPVIPGTRPFNLFVPFLGRRKAQSFDHSVSTNAQQNVDGTLRFLYSRIDLLATYGHADHESFKLAIEDIIGLPITMRASGAGKEAGAYYDRDTFVSIESMGDGISELVAMIVEICTERNKVFLIEEPETNIHPDGIKALIRLIKRSDSSNQFFVTTHSNIVVRELGAPDESKIFQFFRAGRAIDDPSTISEIGSSPDERIRLLADLGYEFCDFEMHARWLFLEESTAERVVRDILIPLFVPELTGRLRTFSTAGAGNLEASFTSFQRVMVFVHLQEIYRDRLWVYMDGDNAGKEALEKIRLKFPSYGTEYLQNFTQENFEEYYPIYFRKQVNNCLSETKKEAKRMLKVELLDQVVKWTNSDRKTAKHAWQESAKEVIEILESIAKHLDLRSK